MKKRLALISVITGLVLSASSPVFAASPEVKDLPKTSWVNSGNIPVVAKWEIPVDSVSPDKNSIFQGYRLGIKADKIFNSQENQWAKHGLFTISLGECGKQPADSDFRKIGSDGTITYPSMFKADKTKQSVCVWGKLPKEGMGIYDKDGKRYSLEEAQKNKSKLENDSNAYYRNTVTVNGVGTISNKEVSDNAYWETFIESYKPFEKGEAKLSVEPEWISPFSTKMPKTGGAGTLMIVGGGVLLVTAASGGYVYLRNRKK